MLIIITRSDDASVNLLGPYFEKPFIRINVDDDTSWSFSYQDGVWSVSNPDLSHVISQDTRCWMWKAYFEEADGDGFRNAEVQYLVREIYAEAARRGEIVGNSPAFHNSFGKLSILDIARQYFHVPATNAVFNHVLKPMEDIVVKSLASSQFANSKVLFTTRTEVEKLNVEGNPWFAQEYLESESDVTTFIAGKEAFSFERPRTPGVTVDWRKEQLQDLRGDAWHPLDLRADEQRAVTSFAEELGVSWGRVDFVRMTDQSLWFLEYNANGQFGFLDEFNRTGILEAIAGYLESN